MQLEGHLQTLGLPIKSCGNDPVPVCRALTAGEERTAPALGGRESRQHVLVKSKWRAQAQGLDVRKQVRWPPSELSACIIDGGGVGG
jgi:hypothetical protein